MISTWARDGAGKLFSTELLKLLPTFSSGREGSVNYPGRKKVIDIHLVELLCGGHSLVVQKEHELGNETGFKSGLCSFLAV